MELFPAAKINWNSFPGTGINSDRIHVFKIQIDKSFNSIARLYHQILSDDELEKASRFLNNTDKQRYITSRYLLRVILGDHLGLSPASIRFYETGKRKPAVAGLEFNISYSANYIVIALGNTPLGIDIEFTGRSFDVETILEDCFDHEEQSFINQENRYIRFYALWTRKEAILKATGEGITDELKTLECMLDIIERNGKTWAVSTFTIDEAYILSLAVNAAEDKPHFWNYDIT